MTPAEIHQMAAPDTSERSPDMRHLPPNLPMPIRPTIAGGAASTVAAVDAHAAAESFAPLLAEPFAQAWATAAEPAVASGLRARLLGRAAASRLAERGMVTVRRRRLAHQALAEGVQAQQLYAAAPGLALRPGEPLRVRLIALADGAVLTPDRLGPALLDPLGRPQACRCEWLVMSGKVWLGDEPLSARDYHLQAARQTGPVWRAQGPALLFLRESADESADESAEIGPPEPAFTLRDADAGWPDFAPGIQRRVLWQQGGQAALLYFAQAGAQVPQHGHGHDEECLMLQGELYLDDLLLQAGDYQLAPAGSGHRITATDTGVVIYAHGDLNLQFEA